MTEALKQRFPEHLPYEGLFETTTPQLTVAQGDDLEVAEAALTSGLPVQSRASSVVLFEQVGPELARGCGTSSLTRRKHVETPRTSCRHASVQGLKWLRGHPGNPPPGRQWFRRVLATTST